MLINYLESELRGVELFSRLRNENSRHARALHRDVMFAIAEMLRRKIRPASSATLQFDNTRAWNDAPL
jgi:hypothetical protein